MIDVRRSPELQAVILLLKGSDRSVRNEMRRAARVELNALWKPTLQSFSRNAQQEKVLVRGARSRVGSDDFQMLAATSRRALSGGLVPTSRWAPVEFGGEPKEITVVRLGRERRQRAGRNLGPRVAKGKVVFPAIRKTGPRVVAAWVNGIVKGLAQGNKNMETTRGN